MHMNSTAEYSSVVIIKNTRLQYYCYMLYQNTHSQYNSVVISEMYTCSAIVLLYQKCTLAVVLLYRTEENKLLEEAF